MVGASTSRSTPLTVWVAGADDAQAHRRAANTMPAHTGLSTCGELSSQLLQTLREGGDDLLPITHDAIARIFENVGVRVSIDSHHVARARDPGDVLNGAADADGDV